jgi:hypothetical protein
MPDPARILHDCATSASFEHSLTIQASVISRQSDKVIVDAGNKSVADPADVTIVGHARPGCGPRARALAKGQTAGRYSQ